MWADRQDHVKAANHFRMAVAHNGRLSEAHHGLGLALLEQGCLDEAETSLRQALVGSNSRAAATLVAIARLQAERGDLDQSSGTAREAWRLQPNLAGACCQLAFNLRDRLAADDLERLRDLQDQPSLSDQVRGQVLYRLASVHDAKGLYGQAAELFHTANELQALARIARGHAYDPDEHSTFIARIIASFTPEWLARSRGWGDPDRRPTFVVGLPRSGTSLVEQILASHPAVHGAGELPDLQKLFEALPEHAGRPGRDPLDCLGVITGETAFAAGRRYPQGLAFPVSASRVVDKMPDNVHLLGLIASILPGARVILCTRDVRDVAVSCWQAGFATIRWANTFEHIARRFADHERLLDHWRDVQPVPWFEICYEELVADIESHARHMIDLLGLDWNPACLEFQSTRRVVRTASMIQVRQPVHTRTVGRWKHDEQPLQPLFQALERWRARPGIRVVEQEAHGQRSRTQSVCTSV